MAVSSCSTAAARRAVQIAPVRVAVRGRPAGLIDTSLWPSWLNMNLVHGPLRRFTRRRLALRPLHRAAGDREGRVLAAALRSSPAGASLKRQGGRCKCPTPSCSAGIRARTTCRQRRYISGFAIVTGGDRWFPGRRPTPDSVTVNVSLCPHSRCRRRSGSTRSC